MPFDTSETTGFGTPAWTGCPRRRVESQISNVQRLNRPTALRGSSSCRRLDKLPQIGVSRNCRRSDPPTAVPTGSWCGSSDGAEVAPAGHRSSTCPSGIHPSETGSFRYPNATRLLTQRPLLNRERESFDAHLHEERTGRRARATDRELSPTERSSQTLVRTAENDKRRELSLSAFFVNWFVGGNSAN